MPWMRAMKRTSCWLTLALIGIIGCAAEDRPSGETATGGTSGSAGSNSGGAAAQGGTAAQGGDGGLGGAGATAGTSSAGAGGVGGAGAAAGTSSAGVGGVGGTGATAGTSSAGVGGTTGGTGPMNPTRARAPMELNSANGRIHSSTYQLTFQLGRPGHQLTATGPSHRLECAAPTAP